MLEGDDSHQEMIRDLETLENTICELLYTIHKKKDPKNEVNGDEIAKWCQQATKEVIFKSKNLYWILGEEEEDKAKNVQKKVDKFEADALEE